MTTATLSEKRHREIMALSPIIKCAAALPSELEHNCILLTLIWACLCFIKGGQFFTHRGIRTTVSFLWLHPWEPLGDQEHCILLHHLCGRCVQTERRASRNGTCTGCYIILLTHFKQFCFKEFQKGLVAHKKLSSQAHQNKALSTGLVILSINQWDIYFNT